MHASGIMSTPLTECSESWQSGLLLCSWANINQSLTLAVSVMIFFILRLPNHLVADCGDYVVLSNARKIKVTGNKAEQLVYRHHTMFPGGLKEISYRDMMAKKPDEVHPTCLHSLLVLNAVDRSSARRCQACCPKTNSGNEG